MKICTSFLCRFIIAHALIVLSSPAVAHVTFEVSEAKAGAYFKAVLKVPHGCNGKATQGIRVAIPEGVVAVKPMPKAGWILTMTKAAFSKPVEMHGRTLNEGVKEIVWSGGSLLDETYDEFVFQTFLNPELAGKNIAFPVVQECGSETSRWVETALASQEAHSLKFPAPLLTVKGEKPRDIYKHGNMVIDAPWLRATPHGAKVGGGFVHISNEGSAADRLLGAKVDFSSRVDVHEMSVKEGVMRMRLLEKGLEIPPHASVELKPGSYHLMFMDIKQPLVENTRLKGTLIFEKAGSVDVEFDVRGFGAGAVPKPAHHHH